MQNILIGKSRVRIKYDSCLRYYLHYRYDYDYKRILRRIGKNGVRFGLIISELQPNKIGE